MHNEEVVNNGIQYNNDFTNTIIKNCDDLTKNIANQNNISVDKAIPASPQLLNNDAPTSSSYSDISTSPDHCESLHNIIELKKNNFMSQKSDDRNLETRKRCGDSTKLASEKRRVCDMEMEKRISELIKENMLLKSRLNGKKVETNAPENDLQPKLSSVIVAGPSFLQQQKETGESRKSFDASGTIPQLFAQHSNFTTNSYNFPNDTTDCTVKISVNKKKHEAKNENDSLTQEKADSQLENKQQSIQSTHKETDSNLRLNLAEIPHSKADTNIGESTEPDSLKVSNQLTTQLASKGINNILPSNFSALCSNITAAPNNITPPEIPLTINCNNYLMPCSVGANVQNTMHSATMLELGDLLQQQQQQNTQQHTQQQIVAAAAAALISNYQAYYHHPQILSSLSLNKIVGNKAVENLIRPDPMNNEDALHLSAFHPFNQLYYQQNLASLNANGPCSSLTMPPFYMGNSKLLNQFDSNHNVSNNTTDVKIMNRNLLQHNYLNLTSQASGSTPVIIQPKPSQSNSNHVSDLTSHQVSSSSSSYAFGLTASGSSEKIENNCNLNILPQPDSSSNESLRLTTALETSTFDRSIANHKESNVRPSVLLHSSTTNANQSFLPDNTSLLTIDTSNAEHNNHLASSSSAFHPALLPTVCLSNSKIETVNENNRKTVLELGKTKQSSYLVESIPKTHNNQSIPDQCLINASSTTDALNAYQNDQSHSIPQLTLAITQNNNNNNINEVSNNIANKDKNVNDDRDNSAPYSSLLGTLLAATRRSPTVPESRTELQSGLGGGSYAASSSSSAIIMELGTTSQMPPELKQYHLLGHNGTSNASTYAASLMPSFSLLKNKVFGFSHFTYNKGSSDEEGNNKSTMTSSSSRYTSSTHSDTKYDSEHSIPSPQSFDSNVSSSAIANSNYDTKYGESTNNKLTLQNRTDDAALTYESLENNDGRVGNGRRDSVLSSASLNSNESLTSRTHVMSPSCRDIFSSSYTSSMSNASISLAKALDAFSYCGSEGIGGRSSRPDLERYMDRRRRNNEAAKRCRANRRAVYEYRFRRAQQLEAENGELRQEMLKLHNELEQLKGILNNGHRLMPNA